MPSPNKTRVKMSAGQLAKVQAAAASGTVATVADATERVVAGSLLDSAQADTPPAQGPAATASAITDPTGDLSRGRSSAAHDGDVPGEFTPAANGGATTAAVPTQSSAPISEVETASALPETAAETSTGAAAQATPWAQDPAEVVPDELPQTASQAPVSAGNPGSNGASPAPELGANDRDSSRLGAQRESGGDETSPRTGIDRGTADEPSSGGAPAEQAGRHGETKTPSRRPRAPRRTGAHARVHDSMLDVRLRGAEWTSISVRAPKDLIRAVKDRALADRDSCGARVAYGHYWDAALLALPEDPAELVALANGFIAARGGFPGDSGQGTVNVSPEAAARAKSTTALLESAGHGRKALYALAAVIQELLSDLRAAGPLPRPTAAAPIDNVG